MGMAKQVNYCSFLLCMWWAEEEGGQEWRASLENVESGEKRGFTRPEEILAYLAEIATTWDKTPGEGIGAEVQG